MAGRVRSKSSVSISSSGRVSFSGSVRLHDLIDDKDEYGFNSADLIDEDAVEATESLSENLGTYPSTADENVMPAGGEPNEDADSLAPEKSSIGSNDSKGSKEHSTGKLASLIDKAKCKGKKLVQSSKKGAKANTNSTRDYHSGDIKLHSSSISTSRSSRSRESTAEADEVQHSTLAGSFEMYSSDCVDVKNPPVVRMQQMNAAAILEAGPDIIRALTRKFRTMPFFGSRMVLLVSLISMGIVFPGFITGLLWGLYISFLLFLYFFVSEPQVKKKSVIYDDSSFLKSDVDLAVEMNSSFEGGALGVSDGVVYRGWMNELRSRYSPAAYHVNSAQSVLVRLEGTTLRISRPAKAVLKHAFHEDPTLKPNQSTMVAQTIYDLSGAKVSLRPKRLAARRWWSRKYPIHIRFANKSSALSEVDLTKAGMSRSASLHPVGSVPDNLPIVSEVRHDLQDVPEDDGYSPESESSDEGGPARRTRAVRSNSAGDLIEFNEGTKGISRKMEGRSIYLFVRAAREKERWFHLLREACAKGRSTCYLSKSAGSYGLTGSTRSLSDDVEKSGEEKANQFANPALEYFLYKTNHIQFSKQMYLLIGSGIPTPEKASTVSVDLGTIKWKPGVPEENSDLVESLNTFATRIFFDFCRDSFWVNAVKQKIQCKLATIHLPYFIETLELSELDLGATAPRIASVFAPKMDEWGIWVDFEMKYEGGIKLSLQTSVNLIKLHNGQQQTESEKAKTKWSESARTSHYSDEDLPESPESSPDEDFGANNETETVRERRGKKILSLIERTAQSSLFQKAAKLSRVAKLMEEVSSTPLMLNVEVTLLEGIMTINIPPPPSDRIWYAFRRVPRINIRAVPQVGDRSVDLTTVSDWIESKLRLLIEKNLVCPNMDDIILPVMSGNSLLKMGYNR